VDQAVARVVAETAVVVEKVVVVVAKVAILTGQAQIQANNLVVAGETIRQPPRSEPRRPR